MSKFMDRFEELRAQAYATPVGQALVAAGFTLEHEGGGCTAWERPIEGIGWRLMITDSEGLGHTLGDSHAYDEGKPDCWLVGAAQDVDGEGTDCVECHDIADALVAAFNLETALRLKHDGIGFGGRA